MKLLFHGTGVYQEARAFGPACWPHYDVIVVKEGAIILETPKGRLRLQGGDAIWIPPKLRFQGSIETERGVIWVLHFSGTRADQNNYVTAHEAGLGVFRGGARSKLATGLMERLDGLYLGNSLWQPLAENYFIALLAELHRNTQLHANADATWSRTLETWARAHLSEGIGVRELATQAGLSESHFRKIFLQRKGISAGKFLHDLRLNEARQLLQQSTFSLKEISNQLGYSDSVAFHRAFATRFQMTPTRFRAQRELMI